MRRIAILALLAASMSAAPSAAATEPCATAPASLRVMAAMADAGTARRAETDISSGEALCAVRQPAAADRKFRLAARALGISLEAVLAAAPATRND